MTDNASPLVRQDTKKKHLEPMTMGQMFCLVVLFPPFFFSPAAADLGGYWQSKTKTFSLRKKDIQSSVANRALPK